MSDLGVSHQSLTLTCRWASSDDKNDAKFPANKQFLITRKVPSQCRIKDIESAASGIKEVEIGDGWVETNAGETANAEDVFDMDANAHVVEETKHQQEQAMDVEEVQDLDDLMNEAPSDNIFDKYVKNDDVDMTDIVTDQKIRKYDLSITYDFYH